MHLLTPIWLTALAAISIPVVIHLWNIRPGKTLKVGSISLFEEASPASSRSLKLLDILLLILRCLLLGLIALFLAKPFLRSKPAANAKGWVLIPPAIFKETYGKYQHSIDSLTAKGYELHLYSAGFKKIDLSKKPLQLPVDSSLNSKSINYWSLLGTLSKNIPNTLPVEIFTTNTAKHFTGNKPGTILNVHWHTYTPADSVKTWPAQAWINNNGAMRVVEGTAKPSGISYQYNEIKNDGQTNSVYDVHPQNGSIAISLKTDTAAKTVVDTATTRIAIYGEGMSKDADYLSAALQAASKFLQRKIQIQVYHQALAVPAKIDWLFWLSEKPVSKTSASNIFYYAPGKTVIVNSWIANGADRNLKQLALYKQIISSDSLNKIWTDAYGKVVLGISTNNDTNLYPFYSRLNPSWNNLVWSDEFPLWILQLLSPEQTTNVKYDTRSLTNEQITPIHITTDNSSFKPQPQDVDLWQYIWIALAIVFFAERWLAHYHKNQPSNG